MKIGFIGTGNMAQAIINGLIEHETVAKEDIFVSSGHFENAQRFAEATGVTACQTNSRSRKTSRCHFTGSQT